MSAVLKSWKMELGQDPFRVFGYFWVGAFSYLREICRKYAEMCNFWYGSDTLG